MICVNRMEEIVIRMSRFRKMTGSNHSGPVAANLLNQDFACDRPGRVWGIDISYVWTAEGWGYLLVGGAAMALV